MFVNVNPPSSFRRAVRVAQLRPVRGFALVLALVLMGLITLLLISLGTLTQVQLSTSVASMEQMQARQNALLGMQVALGQLQRYAGPDQRTTAAADISSTVNTLPTPQSGTRYWTGVWGNSNNPADNEREPVLLTWLVSGNERLTFDTQTAGNSFGRINSADVPLFAPDNVVSPAASSLGNPADSVSVGSAKARMLVGPGTLGNLSGADDGYIVAPLVAVNTEGNSAGAYAYWIGDEGIKARINIVNPYPDTSTAENSADNPRLWSFATAQNVGGNQLSGLTTLPSAISPDNDVLSQILLTEQISLLATGSTQDQVKGHFHNLSLSSSGVLADTRHGGLKRDLTRILENGGGSNEHADNRFIFANSGGSYGPASSAFYTNPPTWGILRDFARFQNAAATPLQPQTPTATRQGISPVLMLASLSYSFLITTDPTNASQQIIDVFVSPRVFLWNPYNRSLAAGEYEIGFQPPRIAGGITPKGAVTFTLEKVDPVTNAIQEENNYTFNMANGAFEDPLTEDRKFFRFRLIMDREWQPGETVSFLPQQGIQDYSAAGNTLSNRRNRQIYDLTRNARIRVARLYVPAADRGTFEVALQDIGEANVYLGAPGAGATAPAGAISPGSTNSAGYYQWIGRVGITTPVGADANGHLPIYEEALFNLPMPTNPTEGPMAIAQIDLYHTLGAGATFTPPLPTRWIAAANPRAFMLNRTGMEIGGNGDLTINPQYFGLISNFSAATYANNNSFVVPVMANPNVEGEVPLGNDYNNTSFDRVSPYSGRYVRPTLFQLPNQGQPLFSIADLRHAATSTHVTSPSYAIGNSLADFRVGLGNTSIQANAGYTDPVGGTGFGPPSQILYDQSYLLNDSLWDGYFFSTVPTTGALPEKLPNSRYRYLLQDGQPPLRTAIADVEGKQAATRLMLEGAFNVNSTSAEAWRAILGALNGVRYDPLLPEQQSADPLRTPFSRFHQTKARSERQAASGNDVINTVEHYSGYRELTDDELNALAERLANEVRERGPFLSLADFVNRNPAAANDLHRLRGALQAAIDNDQGSTTQNQATRINFMREAAGTTGGGRHVTAYTDRYGYGNGFSSAYDVKAYTGWNTTSRTTVNNPFTRSNYFVPGDVTQGDALATIGATLSSRSDTFIIRAYGESVNPQTGDAESQAWCEAVVQRLPEYMDASVDAAHTLPADLQSELNKKFGRRFVVLSFRWLNAEEI